MLPSIITRCIADVSKNLKLDENYVSNIIFKHLYGDCKTTFDAITQSDFDISDHIIKLGGNKCYVLDSVVDLIQNNINQGKVPVDPFTRERFSKDDIDKIIQEKRKVDPRFKFSEKEIIDVRDAVFIVRETVNNYKIYIAKQRFVNDILNTPIGEIANFMHYYSYIGYIPKDITQTETRSEYDSHAILIKLQELWENQRLAVLHTDRTAPNPIDYLLINIPSDWETHRKSSLDDLLAQLEFLS